MGTPSPHALKMTSQHRENSKKTILTVEHLFIKSGTIRAIRVWPGGNMHEIDVHLPTVMFERWTQAQSIKCRITPFHYTDYTPARWNIEEKICTLYIDTSHNGVGSQWTKRQVARNEFHYLKIEAVNQFPVAGKRFVFLGDQTGIGHFCSLQQLAPVNTSISGFIAFSDLQTTNVFTENCPWLSLQAVSSYEAIYQQAEEWATRHQAEKENFMVYLVGHATLVVTLRKLLKSYGFAGSQVKSKGFWQ